ncbi:MAG: hypothetical protein RBU25_03890, partial [Lentisphaeria bacterium]|nr:hypothetical protein [Lentisphaeria bacterium]
MAPQRIKLDTGTIYQTKEGGSFYFRYQIEGKRKSVNLKTSNRKEAIDKAKAMLPVLQAPTVEVVAAHVAHAKKWGRKANRLELTKAWDAYDNHPDHARPATVHIYLRYKAYFEELAAWAIDKGYTFLDEITDEVVSRYVDKLKTTGISVDTHNKRIARISHVVRTLGEYTQETTSDWTNRNFRRKMREEIGLGARRLPFTR